MTTTIKDIDWLANSLLSKGNYDLTLDSDKRLTWWCFKCECRWLEIVKERVTHINCLKCDFGMVTNKSCRHAGCSTNPHYNYPSETKPLYCGKHKLDNMVDLVHKTCQHPNCRTRPIFNTSDQNTPIYCIKHKLPNMVDVANNRCSYPNCDTRPTFNYPGEIRGIYCTLHQLPSMIEVVSRKCQFKDCNTFPIYNEPGEKKPLFCLKHKTETMIDVKNKTCEHPGCKTQPAYNFPGEKRGIRCSEHKLDNMVNLINKKCEYPGCKTHPSFNEPGEKIGIRCVEHRTDNMVNVLNKRCEYSECKKYSTFGYERGKGIYCSEHKKIDMVNVKDKLCIYEDCNASATYNFRGVKGKIYCTTHKLDGMVTLGRICKHPDCSYRASYNIFGQIADYCSEHKPIGAIRFPTPRCKNGTCTRLATHGVEKANHCEFHSTTNEIDLYSEPCKKCNFKMILDQKGLCEFCNNDSPEKIIHAKEIKVRDSLIARGYKYLSHDKILERGNCGKERPDFLFDCGYHFLIVEVDENQHSNNAYNCERTRMFNIANTLGIKTFFIRYNPDKYKKPFQTKREENETHNARMETLSGWLNLCMTRSPTDLVVSIYLFYDGYDGTYRIETFNTPEDIEKLNKTISA